MSTSGATGGYNPPKPTKFTFEDVANFSRLFKELLADEPFLKWAIIAAGIGGVLESLHVLWLASRYIFRF